MCVGFATGRQRRAPGPIGASQEPKHCVQPGLRCLITLSTTHTCPLALSVCWYTHLAIWTVAVESHESEASSSRASSSARCSEFLSIQPARWSSAATKSDLALLQCV